MKYDIYHTLLNYNFKFIKILKENTTSIFFIAFFYTYYALDCE